MYILGNYRLEVPCWRSIASALGNEAASMVKSQEGLMKIHAPVSLVSFRPQKASIVTRVTKPFACGLIALYE